MAAACGFDCRANVSVATRAPFGAEALSPCDQLVFPFILVRKKVAAAVFGLLQNENVVQRR
jgi:hypothetical protein